MFKISWDRKFTARLIAANHNSISIDFFDGPINLYLFQKTLFIIGNETDIGLIVREPEDENDSWAVELLPGNYMAFFEPWDSGEYDT